MNDDDVPEYIPIPNQERERIIIRTSMKGIIANLSLTGLKALAGVMSGSIAIISDAVNNLTDAMSSVVTILGTKLASKEPDKKHPMGYGRIEYLATMIIAAIILYAGVTTVTESINKIINPDDVDYPSITLLIMALAVIVKIILGKHFQHVGKKVRSDSLIASGKDAMWDAVLSASVLICAIIYIVWSINLEAYVGIMIAAFIIRTGIEILIDTLNNILGKRMDEGFTDSIKKTICEDPRVYGAYDLIIHTYGPDKLIASVHIEVPSSLAAHELDIMERRIAERVYAKHGVLMGGIGVYSVDDSTKELREEVTDLVMSYDGVIQVHGFNLDRKNNIMNLDIIIDFSIKNRKEIFEKIRADVARHYPQYTVSMVLDGDI